MKLAFVVADQYRDQELDDTVAQLSGHEITITSSKTGTIPGADGGSCEATILTADIAVENFDGIVLIGGPGIFQQINAKSPLYNTAKEKAKAFNSAGKLVAAICICPVILADAGLLSGKDATVCSGAESKLSGATYKSDPVVQDGNIITGSGPSASSGFGQAINSYFP
jgi:protease I